MYYQPDLNLSPEEVLDYLRKSRSDDPMLSVEEVLEKHEHRLDEWSEKHLGAKVPEENKYRELGSGETIADRPAFQQLLKRIESPKIKAIKVVEIQRLSRGDLEDAGRLMKLLRYTNTLVITPERTYDLRNEYDRDYFERELKRGNDYLEYTKRIMSKGRLDSVEAGNYVGSVAPYGYEKIIVMDGKKKCPTLKVIPEQAEVVRMIFDMYVNQDMGRTNICHTLDDMGIAPPKGERWSSAALKDMLENVHYIGKVKWNWRKTVTIVEDSEIVRTRPKSRVGEYLVYDGKHKAIISEELFNAAREKQGRNHRAKPTTKVRNPLASILYCRCGRAMSLRTYKYKGAEPRLICDDQTHCKTGSCLYAEMIDRVVEILKECIEDFEIRLNEGNGDSVKMHAKLIKNLEKKMKDLQAKELSQWEQQSHPDPDQRMPAHIFKMLNEKLTKEKEEVHQALCKAYESMPEPVDYEEKIHTFQDALDALLDPEVDALKKNALLKQCIERIDYHREKLVRTKSQQVTYYDPIMKKTRYKSPMGKGATWTNPPIELDVKLKV
jgi:DNA invertase Pin-like site-specific DNA recombinase